MRIELTFLEDENQNKRFILRALASMCIISLFSFLWYSMIGKQIPTEKNTWVGIFIIFLLLGSAIAIQLPENSKTSITYGFMLGLLVYGIGNSMLFLSNCSTLSWSLIEMIRGTISTTLTAFLVYKIFF